MSYILDALKRSETERQRQDSPVFSDVPLQRHSPNMPTWLWLVIALLLINAVVLGAVLLRGILEKPPAVVAAPAALPAAPPVQAPVQAPVEPVRTENSALAEPTNTTPQRRSSPPPVRTPIQSASLPATPPAQPAPRRSEAQGPFAQTSSVPTLLQLSADGVLQLPELHLDIHVYSDTPEDRFVFVNMSKYRESARLTEGPLVKEIVPEGVILEYRDSTFLLPRE